MLTTDEPLLHTFLARGVPVTIERQFFVIGGAVLAVASGMHNAVAENTDTLDRRAIAFLDEHRHSWRDWNVRYADGKALHELVLKNGFKRVLEVGTSTGHSAIWLAWAVAKTGGRVTTLEIHEGRHREALANFKLAGVDAYIDARLGNAHELVKTLPGPWDLVFQDADKSWYLNYWNDLKRQLPPWLLYG